MHTCVVSHVQRLAVLWTVALQASLSMRLSRQEYWSGLPLPPPSDLPDPGIEPVSPALQVDSLPLSHWGSQKFTKRLIHHEQVGFIEAV